MWPSQQTRTPLTGVDAAWLRMDVPTNPMVITIALTFDEPIEFQRVHEMVTQRLLRFTRFAQRVTGTQSNTPCWEDDPSFSLEAHLHRIGLPGAGDDAALREMLSALISMPLDPSRPLWQLYLVERYGEGCALVLRVHHCLADGVALVQVFNSLVDSAPTTALAPVHTTRPAGLLDYAFDGLGTMIRSTDALLTEGLKLFSNPERAINLLSGGVAVLSKLALLGPDAPSIFKGPLSVTKRVAWSKPVPLATVKAISRVLGGTVNDVILTAVAGALRRYLLARGEPVSTHGVRAMVPVNLLPPGAKSDGGNHFGLVYVTLPLAVEDQVERMAQLHHEMAAIKASPEAHISYSFVGMLGAMPVGIERTLVDALCRMATLVVTNVPGPRKPNTLAGKPVRRVMFWVPEAAGIGMGVSIFSYAGGVQVGVLVDVTLIPDPEVISAAFDAEMADLIALERAAAG